MNDELIIAVARTNEVPYGDPETVPGTQEDISFTYIARVLRNPFGPVAVDGWEMY